MQVFIETGYYSPVTGINNTPLGSSNYCLIRLISGLETRLQILHKLTFTLVDYRNYKYFRFSNPFWYCWGNVLMGVKAENKYIFSDWNPMV